MLCASRLSETHALGTQTLSAEPGAWAAARPPACGPALQPDTHAAASATTPNPTNQIRLTTRTPSPASQEVRSQSPLRRGGRSRSARPSQSLFPEERPRLGYLPKHSVTYTGGPSLVAPPGRPGMPPTHRSRGAALTLSLNAAGPPTGARSRWRGTAIPARVADVGHHHRVSATNRRR